jgi:hypothetical protein
MCLTRFGRLTQQVGHAGLLVLQLFERLVDALWLKASIGRPSTTLYSPFSQVTGKPNITSLGMPYQPWTECPW